MSDEARQDTDTHPDPKADPQAAREHLDDLEEEIEETRDEAREHGVVEDRDEPTTGFTPRTADNPVDPGAPAGGTLPRTPPSTDR